MTSPRKDERIRSLLSGQVIFNQRASTIDCVVKNISAGGARLEITDSTALPAEFELSIPHKSRVYRAQAVWRGEGLVGVQFVDAVRSVEQPEDEEPDFDKVRRLTAENAKLKAQVQALKARVMQLSGEE